MNNTKDAMYCRLCALLKGQKQLRTLQVDDESCQTVVNQLSKFNIVLDLQDNILPKTVCLPCVKSLEKAFRFVTAVEEAQAFLCDFILVKVNTAVAHSCEENIFCKGDHKNDIIHFKDENWQDPMEVNDGDTHLSEDIDSEVMTDMYNVNAESEVNGNTEEHIKMENKDDIHNVQSTNDVEENIDKCAENPDINHVDNVKNLLNDILERDNNNSKSNLITNTVCSTDELNKHNDSNVATNNMDKSVQKLPNKPKHRESKSKKKSPKRSNTTVHSKTNKNKKQKFKENDQKDDTSDMVAKNTYTDIEHIKMSWKEYKWQCSRCETLFANIDDLQKHSMQFHDSCNLYQCIDCGTKRSDLKRFLIHVREHRTDLNYSCHKCFEKFPIAGKAGFHRNRVHENSKYLCLGCRTPFHNNKELKEHVDKYYRKTKTNTPSDLTCRICNMIFANGEEWRRHRVTHKSKEFLCDTCGRSYLTKQMLKDHSVTHGTIVKKLYKCDICKTTFKSKCKLRYHTNIHSGIKPFTCDDCGKTFRTKHNIAQHMIIHTKYRPYTCTVCNKKFRTNTNFGTHMRQHTGAQPFSCDICVRDFTDLSNRNKHMRRRHGIEMAKKRQLTAASTAAATFF